MRKYLTILFVLLSFPVPAADICAAIALREVKPIGGETGSYSVEKDGVIASITQIWVNKHDGTTSFCTHGGGCFPMTAIVNGKTYQVMRLTNCTLGKLEQDDGDPDAFLYDPEVIRAAIPPERLAIEDIDNKLLNLGLCSACAANASFVYIRKPESFCARLVGRVLDGDKNALERLENSQRMCQQEALRRP